MSLSSVSAPVGQRVAQFVVKFSHGFVSPLVGASLIATTQTLRRLSVLPFLITVFVFVVGLAVGLPFITSMVTPFARWMFELFGVRTSTPSGEALSVLVPFLMWPALALALVYVLLTLTRLFASPFYSLLAKRVLMKHGALPEENVNAAKWFQRQFRLTRSAVLKAVLFLLIGLILGLLSFIPGLGLFTSFAFLVLLAYDVVDYSLEAMAWRYQKRVEFFRRHFAVFLGLGASLALVFLIPGLNFFLLPASVVGASDLVRRMIAYD